MTTRPALARRIRPVTFPSGFLNPRNTLSARRARHISKIAEIGCTLAARPCTLLVAMKN
jgi:hypothetical protein